MKTDAMTSKERILNALRGRPVDRLPFSPFLAYVWESFPRAVQERGQLAFHREVGADPLWRGAPCPLRVSTPGAEQTTRRDGGTTVLETATPVGTLRSVYDTPPGPGMTAFLSEHPLKTEEDYKVQLWIEEHTRVEYDPAPAEEFLRGDGREGLAVGMLVFRGKTAFQSLVEHYAGTQALTQHLFLEFPETVEALCAAMRENDLKGARLAAQSPYEAFLTFEDSSTQNYSPAMYRQYIAPEIAEYCDTVHAAGKIYLQHACGHVKLLLPMMRDCGVDAVESLSPPPTGNIGLKDARAAAGTAMGIVGGIEPTHFLNLTVEELGPYVEQVIADGAGGPFLLANSDSCPPGVTVEKFRRVAEVARACAG